MQCHHASHREINARESLPCCSLMKMIALIVTDDDVENAVENCCWISHTGACNVPQMLTQYFKEQGAEYIEIIQVSVIIQAPQSLWQQLIKRGHSSLSPLSLSVSRGNFYLLLAVIAALLHPKVHWSLWCTASTDVSALVSLSSSMATIIRDSKPMEAFDTAFCKVIIVFFSVFSCICNNAWVFVLSTAKVIFLS